jgi:hypothetical protein
VDPELLHARAPVDPDAVAYRRYSTPTSSQVLVNSARMSAERLAKW